VLLSSLARAFPSTRFSAVVGADLVPSLPSWRHAQALLQECSFLLVPRPGYATPALRADAGGTASGAWRPGGPGLDDAGAQSPPPACTAGMAPASEAPTAASLSLTAPAQAWLVRHRDGSPLRTADLSSTLLRDTIRHSCGSGGSSMHSAPPPTAAAGTAAEATAEGARLGDPWASVETLAPAAVVGYMRAKRLYATPPFATPASAT